MAEVFALTTSRMAMRVTGTYTLLIWVHAVESEPDDNDVDNDDVRGLLILSNEEKRIIMKFLKKA